MGKLLLAFLLLLAGFGDGARTRAQRRERGDAYWILPPAWPSPQGDGRPPDLHEREFTLRHIYHHGSHQYPNLHRYLDVPSDASLRVSYDGGETYEEAPRKLRAKAKATHIQRLVHRAPSDIDTLLDHAYAHGEAASLPSTAWTTDEIASPNTTDRDTILTFAKMASNAYVQNPADGDWKDVKGGFNYTDDFGWQTDGLRGHIFADETNKTIVIGLKGTSPAVFDGSETTGNDKLNDNLFGSCCCGQGGQSLWKQVCNCMTSAYTCNNTCLVRSLRERSRYYRSVRELYHNVTERYPDVEYVWLSGHSLGGVVSSLLGLTYGLPTLTFEAFPDALAASRLGLPIPPGYTIGSHQSRGAGTGIYHFGHTADPIYMGDCNAAFSFCSMAGYAFQGKCHTGQTCIYDTVGDLGWRVGIGTHKINNVIKDVLEQYDTVPSCEEDTECSDCFNWKFFESNGSEPITSTSSSTSSSTRTRTETCKTPGWWGCLDESTTSGPTTTTSTSSSTSTTSSSTSTCKTPGWFGCKDPTTTTTSAPVTTPPVTTTSTPLTSTSTCETPGWFGCNDLTTTTTTTTAEPAKTAFSTAPAPTAPQPRPSSLPRGRRKKCLARYWYGMCRQWDDGSMKAKGEL